MAALYPRLLAYHRWWAKRARSRRAPAWSPRCIPGRPGWTTARPGTRRSPACRLTTRTAIRRRDTAHVDAVDAAARRGVSALHPSGRMLPRRRLGARAHAGGARRSASPMSHQRDPAARRARSRWRSRGASAVPRSRRRSPRGSRAWRRAIERLWSEAEGIFSARDLIGGAPIPVATSAGLLPLFGGGAGARAARLAQTLRAGRRRCGISVPSTAPDDPRFEPRRYWRGPVWAVVNWMIAEGLDANGETALAARAARRHARPDRCRRVQRVFRPADRRGHRRRPILAGRRRSRCCCTTDISARKSSLVDTETQIAQTTVSAIRV